MIKQDMSKPNFDGQGDQKKWTILFTKRESQCIAQAMQNKNLSQIAKSLGIKERTVYFYLMAVKNKLSIFYGLDVPVVVEGDGTEGK